MMAEATTEMMMGNRMRVRLHLHQHRISKLNLDLICLVIQVHFVLHII